MKTFILKKEDVVRDWYHFDANGANLGRLAEKIARILMGKNRPEYTPHVDSGDFVIVTNIDKITVSGRKETDKIEKMREELGVNDNLLLADVESSFNVDSSSEESQVDTEEKDINEDIEASLRQALESLDF